MVKVNSCILALIASKGLVDIIIVAPVVIIRLDLRLLAVPPANSTLTARALLVVLQTSYFVHDIFVVLFRVLLR